MPDVDPAEAGEPFVFDWQAQPEGFLKWMIPNLITGISHARFSQLSSATDGWRSVVLTIQINGVPVPAQQFVEGVERNMEHYATEEARRLLSEAGRLDDLGDLVRDVEREVSATIRRRLAAAGIYLEEDDD